MQGRSSSSLARCSPRRSPSANAAFATGAVAGTDRNRPPSRHVAASAGRAGNLFSHPSARVSSQPFIEPPRSVELEGAATFGHSEVSSSGRTDSESAANASQLVASGWEGSSHDSPIAFRQWHADASLPAFLGLVRFAHSLTARNRGTRPIVGGSKIGYTHTYVEKVKDQRSGKDYLRVRIDIELKLKRDKDVSVIKMQYGTIETLDGQVLRLDTRTLVGEDHDLRAHGDVIRGEMILKLDGNGEHQSLKIPWGPEVRGPYAPEQSMARKPMKEHETTGPADVHSGFEQDRRHHAVFSCDRAGDHGRRLDAPAPARRADDPGRRQAPDGIQQHDVGRLRAVRSSKPSKTLFGKLVTYRTTKEGAMAPGGPIQFDLITGTVIKTPRPHPQRGTDPIRQVSARRSAAATSPRPSPPTRDRPFKHENDQDSAILVVQSLGPLDGQPGPAEVDAQYLKPNVLITSQDSRVRSLAQASHARRGRSLGQGPAHESLGFPEHHATRISGSVSRGRAKSPAT